MLFVKTAEHERQTEEVQYQARTGTEPGYGLQNGLLSVRCYIPSCWTLAAAESLAVQYIL